MENIEDFIDAEELIKLEKSAKGFISLEDLRLKLSDVEDCDSIKT